MSVFSVSSGGALTQVAGSPFATGSDPFSVAFSPGGGLLATANFGASTVSVFSVGSGGALTQVAGSPFTTDTNPRSVAFSPSGGLLATANLGASTVSVFSVGSGGALSAVAGSPFTTGTNPNSVAFSPGGGLLATANYGASTVSVFADSDLALAGVPADVTTGATGPAGVVVNYTPPTATDEDSVETPTVGCLPASGSLFAIGTTTVTCTASDADDSNSPVHATFTVTVKGGLAQLKDLLASVGALPSSTAKTVLSVQVADALSAEQSANTSRVCLDLFGIVRTARQEQAYGQLTPAQATQVITAADQIAAVVGCGGTDPPGATTTHARQTRRAGHSRTRHHLRR